LKQIEFALQDSYSCSVKPYGQQTYANYDCDGSLSEFSQKNEYCKRTIAVVDSVDGRSEFQRDRERIVHAKAFRRLVDKAQIFTSLKGDHYRTRMTHTLEVSQIARGIAIKLDVNTDLTEAIALAHDIGHTPFGHQGERTLDDILKNRIEIIPDAENIDFGGFKHNFQGLRVLSYLEEKYFEHEGLDLSYQLLEGVLKHTRHNVKKCSQCDKSKKICGENCCDISEFLINGEEEYLFLDSEFDFATTLEGQIVSIADEIAQRGHDLDDAFASQHLDFEDLLLHAKIRKMFPIKKILNNLDADFKNMENKNRIFINKADMLRSRLVPEILGYFISDVITQSKINIQEYEKTEKTSFYNEEHRLNKKIVGFSPEGKFILEYLEKIISKRVVNSHEVGRFDDKARRVITELFKAYYHNPKLLPDGTLMRVYKDIKKISNNVIDFRNGDPKLISKELKSICFDELSNEYGNINQDSEFLIKRKILVRNITDYLAGMTDNFATNEYNLLFESK
jgi:dGTPase